MGVATTSTAGKGSYSCDQSAKGSFMVYSLLKKDGYTCPVDVSEHKTTDSDEEDDAIRNYMKEYYYENTPLEKNGEKLVFFSANNNFVYVRCMNAKTADAVIKTLSSHFVLARLDHSEGSKKLAGGMTAKWRSGVGEDHPDSTDPGTLFELQKYNKTICKCICSYSNGEMSNVGPTIEILETAKQWQCHGFASELLAVVEEFFYDLFQSVGKETSVKFNVCYVTSRHACEWFLSKDFEDWDGMGEELGKMLF